MGFDINCAMADYINNPDMSYRKLAEKYSVSYSLIAKEARKNGWVNKRKMNSLQEGGDNTQDKLSLLKKTSDSAIEKLYAKLWEDEVSINDLKNIASILKTLTAVQRDLNNLPTYKEENTIRISNERLKLVKTGTRGEEDEAETGIVLIPWLDEEEEEYLSGKEE